MKYGTWHLDHTGECPLSPLTRALSLNPSNTIALYNRAVANLSAGHWDAALQDYQALDRMYPNSYQIAFGFGEIAYNKHDTNLAVRHYESYLANAPTNTVDAEKVRTKLKELRPGAS